MKKTRYSESQIVKALKEVEGGRNVKDMCRDYGRDRNAGHPAPLAQIPACATNALGSYLRF